MEEYMLPCMNKKLLGIECFGCGTQRSFLLLIKGDFVGAFNMFPAIFTTVLFFLVLALHFIDKSRNYQKAIISLAVINAIIIVVSYFYRLTN
ncbi:DUF2752 domain-containing protein [Flavobacterium dankookense]|uniref:Uncharacterized protein DUF2752 n=1 Tax=Flavobacterium dankookense TaxID=706186 RepID=A0A4R6QA64_9FLAO|nr:DUF2752 domain-containing protein [Flavobacterium dankookense]TDP59524.1 uncharacterized protein DUF2752 [Flavobacterium dankookense]